MLLEQNSSLLGSDIWGFELEDGSYCELMKGATFVSHDSRANYGCTSQNKNQSRWILGFPKSNKIWTAYLVTLSTENKIISNEIVKIKKIYK